MAHSRCRQNVYFILYTHVGLRWPQLIDRSYIVMGLTIFRVGNELGSGSEIQCRTWHGCHLGETRRGAKVHRHTRKKIKRFDFHK